MKFRFGIAAALAALLVLAGAPIARAELGVTGYFKYPAAISIDPDFGKPGFFSTLRGVAVNHGGVGGVGAGDLYALDNGRVQQFSAVGNVVNTWNREGEIRAEAGDVAINPANGEIYVQTRGSLPTNVVGSRSETDVYSATGDFLRRFGYDVVATGPDDSANQEQQKLVVNATGGSFTLSCCKVGLSPALKTVPIAFNAPANDAVAGTPGVVDSVEEALNQLGAIGGVGGHVTVTGGPAGPGEPGPGPFEYTITYGGMLAGDDFQQLSVDPGHLTGDTRVGRIVTIADGGGLETCVAGSDVCGDAGIGEDAFKPGQGVVSLADTLTLAPGGAPNAGNVLLPDWLYHAISEFTPAGEFVRSFGWDVVSHGPGDSTANEQQKLTIDATGGKFSLTFPDVFSFNGQDESPGPTTGAFGTGEVTGGSSTIENVETTGGAFSVGETIADSAKGIPPGTTIIAVDPGAHTLTLSAGAGSGNHTFRELTANDLPYNASAAQVELALDALPSIGGVGGSVSVTGAGTGADPYLITFGGTLGGDDLVPVGTSMVGLSGGSKTAISATLADGGAFETCVDADLDVCKAGVPAPRGLGSARLGHIAVSSGKIGGIAEDSSGAIYASDGIGANPTLSNFRVQKFTPAGPGLTPSAFGSPEQQRVTVSAGAGQFRLNYVQTDGTRGTGEPHQGSTLIDDIVVTGGEFAVGQPIRLQSSDTFAPGTTIVACSPTCSNPTTLTISQPAGATSAPPNTLISNRLWPTVDLEHDATSQQVEDALNDLPPIEADGGSVSVSGGVGDPAGTSPYVVSFDGPPQRGADQVQMIGADGTTPLGGGSGGNANTALVSTIAEAQPGGTMESNTPVDVAIDDADHVYVAKQFPAGAAVCPNGSNSPSELRIQQFATDGSYLGTSEPCYGIPSSVGSFGAEVNLTVDPVSGEPYVAVFYNNGATLPIFTSTFGYGAFAFVLDELGAGPDMTLDSPSNIEATGVTLSGEIDSHGPVGAAGHPNPTETTYQVQLRESGEPTWLTYAPPTSIGSGIGPVPFSVGISGLTPKTTYEFRLIVRKLGRADLIGPVQTVTTASAPPAVDNLRATNVTIGSVDLHARINPRGTDTTYRFEYGSTLNYGHETPEVDIGDSQFPVDVQAHIGGLEPVVYHFRAVATNSLGTTRTADQTFNFYPEPCPNLAVRQQTGAARLPDCRGYEIVSPADAGSVVLLSGGPNSPYASSPPRFSFFGIVGAVPDSGHPSNFLGDHYVATRSSVGWQTHYVGIPSEERFYSSGPPNLGPPTTGNEPHADSSLDRILAWDNGGSFRDNTVRGSMAPYVYDSQGNNLGRLPTNVSSIPGGEADLLAGGFIGDTLLSPDYGHYFFSSANVAFTADGLTSGSGSVYDNEISTGTVTKVSMLNDGSDIPPEPGDLSDDYLTLPGTSTDGSHILMAAAGTGVCGKATCPPAPDYCGAVGSSVSICPTNLLAHLYMRVDHEITYDVSGGHLVKYVGMTSSGSTVYFTSPDQITGDDNDTSVDLYMWTEGTNSITRVSAGSSGVVGDTDACSPTWTTRCNVEVVPFDASASLYAPPTDNSIAADSGDVYFYSPEQFVGSRGIPARRNLYVFRNGSIHFVATLDVDRPLRRIQVSPDGRHTALITATQLTGFDNTAGLPGSCDGLPDGEGAQSTDSRCAEMYLFDAVDESVTCVSCRLDGEAPNGDVGASQDGIFMSDDGRPFFSTTDALVPEDTNGLSDVYEYASGRPQLISTGSAAIDTGRLGDKAGLVGVSADGIDVYFSSFQKIVASDHNGQQLRFYDARTNGGFPSAAPLVPCQAADECHGTANEQPSPPAIGSTAELGSGGNVRPSCKRKGKPRCPKHRRRHRKHQGAQKHKGAHGRRG